MPEETKFTEEELHNIKDIQSKYFKVQQELGQSAINKLKLAQQIEFINNYEEDLAKQFTDIQGEEKKFVEGITKKYGEGVLNPDSGIFKTKTAESK